jgi:hypothetical protein
LEKLGYNTQALFILLTMFLKLINFQEQIIAWILFQKKKWRFQMLQRCDGQPKHKKIKGTSAVVRTSIPGTLGGFLQKAQRALITFPWQIIQIMPTATSGEFRLWALVS